MDSVADFERQMPGFGQNYPDVPAAGSVASQHTSSNLLNLNSNHHDKRYVGGPIAQSNNFQLPNSTQVASQNTMTSSVKDGYETDRSMTSAPVTSRFGHTSPMIQMTVSDFEKFRGSIFNRAFAEGYSKGQEVGYLESNRTLQRRSHTQDAAVHTSAGEVYDSKQHDAPPGYSSNSHTVRRRSMTVASLPATSRSQISRYNGNPDAFESGPPAKSWASPTHDELLASIYPPVAPLSHVPGAAAPTNVTTISFANGAQSSQSYYPPNSSRQLSIRR